MSDLASLADFKQLFFGGGTAKELEFYKQATERGLKAFDLLNPTSPRPSVAAPWIGNPRGGAGFAFPVDQMRLSPIWLPKGTITEVSWEVNAGTATSLTLAVLYDTSEADENQPGNLLIETDQVDSSVAGIKNSVLAQNVELEYEGWYWAGVINKVAASTIIYGGGITINQAFPNPAGNILRSVFAWRNNDVSGGIPDPWVQDTFDVNSPVTAFKYEV